MASGFTDAGAAAAGKAKEKPRKTTGAFLSMGGDPCHMKWHMETPDG